MSTRTGKIARLPASIRDDLNERLHDGLEQAEILDWLNALPAVQDVMQKNFQGAPVSKQNLSEWRQGGFQDWLLLGELCDAAEGMAEAAESLTATRPNSEVIDDVARLLALRLGRLVTRWNSEADEKLQTEVRLLNDLCRSVVRLQRSTHRAHQDRYKEQELAEVVVEKENKTKRTILMREFLCPRQKGETLTVEDVTDQYMYRVMSDDFKGALEILKKGVKIPAQPAAPAESASVKPDQTNNQPEIHPDPVALQKFREKYSLKKPL